MVDKRRAIVEISEEGNPYFRLVSPWWDKTRYGGSLGPMFGLSEGQRVTITVESYDESISQENSNSEVL